MQVVGGPYTKDVTYEVVILSPREVLGTKNCVSH